MQGGAATPRHLLKKMVERADEFRDVEFRDVELVSISTQGEALFAEKKYHESFRDNSLFVFL